MNEVSLDRTDLEFNAPSYVWGPNSPQPTLWVDDVFQRHRLSIQPNLAAALHRLRSNRLLCCNRTCGSHEELLPEAQRLEWFSWNYPNYLWVDAICIDQSSIEERAQ